MEGELHNKAKLWALMLIDADFDDAGLSLAARGVYVHLCRRADKAHVAWPGINSIADTVRVDRKTVMAAIRELEKRGFLRVVRAWGSRSNYEILAKHCWRSLPNANRSKTDAGSVRQKDRFETRIGSKQGPATNTDQSVRRTGPEDTLVPATDGTSPSGGRPPVRCTDRKDNHRRITNRRIANDDNAHARESEAAEASSSCGSVSILSRKEEPDAGALGDRSVSEATTISGGEAGTTYRRNKDQGVSIRRARVIFDQGVAGDSEDTDEAPPDALHNLLAGKLAGEFRLTARQRQRVTEYCESRGEDYVASKAEVVRSAPRKNAAGALLAALRDDWQPAVVTGETANKAARLAASRTMAERMGWEW